MTQEQYDTSIATRELHLNGFWEKSSHFGLPFYTLIFPATLVLAHLFGYFKSDPLPFKAGEAWFIAVPLVLGCLFFFIQKRRLKFKVIQTTLTHDQIKAIIEKVAAQLKWNGHFTSAKIYEATTNPGFFSGSWGEQITILLPDNQVWVNSICDLQKRSSVVSMGRNRKNAQTIIDRIKAAQQGITASV
ncbi:hypothetical protein [Mucilaginibacter gotjawali]|uniref:Uncharacterized protein n=2 Tax=Mucilaginibacter gotjawali TaxID=1550579 RepID=A0A839SHZ3_9SPHI|nr:hypothetical protein [Mucilaginibacter gotjawali]MBB3057875.1 hypothetical protein [Mucilaginibacter gotjawali]BAU52353.1 hypothetical protein MgSA37_00508 [Mucilaginibacter gotjawali]